MKKGSLLIGGMEVCRFLQWDSNFFGVPIARLLPIKINKTIIKAGVEWCRKKNISCLYYLAAPNHYESVFLAESNQFNLVDIRVTFSCELCLDRLKSQTVGNVNIRQASLDDQCVLERIIGNISWRTRFSYDPHFNPERVNLFYSEWLKKSLHNMPPDNILVAELKDQIVGFVTCTYKQNIGKIALIGVDPYARGSSVGKHLVFSTLKWFSDRGCSTVEVVTQGRNIEAQRMYHYCGFLPKSIYLWFHKWL